MAAIMNRIASFRAMCVSRISRYSQATADIPTTQPAYSQYEFKGIQTDAFFSPAHSKTRICLRRTPMAAVAAPAAEAARRYAIPYMDIQTDQETT